MTIAVPISLIMKIFLEEVKVFAYHGWYDEERESGHWFSISLEAEISDRQTLTDDLAETFNYELIYQIVISEMKQTQKLLETVAENILNQVLHFDAIKNCKVKIAKTEPHKMPGVSSVAIELWKAK